MEKDNAKYKILVVEDNPGDFALIEDYLHEQILVPDITHVLNFKESKDLFLKGEKNFDAILLDLSLPDKSGEALILEIVKYFIHSPIIVLTGYTDVSFSIKSLSFGISDYLLKDELNALSLYKSIVYNIERKKTLLELEESEKRYSDLFHFSPLPMLVYELETLKFLDVNSSAINHYGYSFKEFLVMTFDQIIATDNAVVTSQQKLKSTQHSSKGIFQHRKKSGELIQVDIKSNRIIFKGKSAEVIVANDITERLNYISAIEHQNKKLQEIAWIQSHIVRAPLAKIMGLIDLLKAHKMSEEEKQNTLLYILKSAQEFDTIIKDIVAKTEQVNLNINENEI